MLLSSPQRFSAKDAPLVIIVRMSAGILDMYLTGILPYRS